MKRGPQKHASVGDIARAAGVSRVAVSYALRNKPGVSAATRLRILKLAKKMHYKPDARIKSWMVQVRGAKNWESIPIAWLNTGSSRDMWHETPYLQPYLEGARQRCAEMGYRLEEFWLKEPGMKSHRISQILFNRGIRGVVVTPPDRLGNIHLRLNWEWFASVSFEKALIAPKLFQVAQDRYYNVMLSLKRCHRLGFRRIAVLVEQQSDRRSAYGWQAAAGLFFRKNPDLVELPLLYSGPTGFPSDFPSWLRRYKPDVIVGQNSHLIERVEAAGFKVPKQISVVHVALEDDCADWTGVWAGKREIGAATVDWVISLVQNQQWGLPVTSRDSLIRGVWKEGKTLIRPHSRSKLLTVK